MCSCYQCFIKILINEESEGKNLNADEEGNVNTFCNKNCVQMIVERLVEDFMCMQSIQKVI